MSLLERQLKAQAAETARQVPPMSTPTPTPTQTPGPPDEAPPGSLVPALIPAKQDRAAAGPRNLAREEMIHAIRVRMQSEVISAFDTLLDGTTTDTKTKLEAIVDRVISANGFAVNRDERLRLVEDMVHEITGFGPLEPLLNDPTITEVMVNGPEHIYIERAGKIIRVESFFLNEEHVLRIIDRIITPLGRRLDETSPRVDARLPDGSRVNAIIAPLSLIGPVITVRKFSRTPYTVQNLINFGTSTPEMFDFLRACIEARLNVFVSGGTGSGKTTFLNVLSSFIPNDERIVTIEDAAELQLRQEHVITLEARPANIEGTGEISIRDLLRNAMHMRPDRIIVGECRSGEALDMLQAMTTGQDGSLSTGHANTPRDMLRRLETMVLMTGYELPLRAIREQIASAVDVLVHTARLKDGSRKVTNITEVYGIEDDEILTQDIFTFVQTGMVDGKIQGEPKATGIRPTFMGQFARAGIQLPPGEYGIPPEDPAKPIRPQKGRFGLKDASETADVSVQKLGEGRAVKAGGMLYVTSVGPINPETQRVIRGGIKEHSRQALANLKGMLEANGSSLDKIVWANWSLREPSDFEIFNEEWVKIFPADGPIGQSTIMPPLHRRAGFRVTLGVIAGASWRLPMEKPQSPLVRAEILRAMTALPLDSRQARIARILLGDPGIRNVEQLASELHLTNRVVRYNLPSVEAHLAEQGLRLRKRRGLGVWVEGADDRRAAVLEGLHSSPGPDVLDVEDRHSSILLTLLDAAPEPVRSETLEARLGVSRPTVRRDVRIAEVWLEQHRLHLRRQPGVGLSVRGSEVDVRAALLALVLEHVPANALASQAGASGAAVGGAPDRLATYLAELDLPTFRAVLASELRELEDSDPTMLTATLSLAILVNRVRNDHPARLGRGRLRSLLDHPVSEAARHIASAIRRRLAISLAQAEIAFITESLLGFAELTDPRAAPEARLVTLVDELVAAAGARLHPSLAADDLLRANLIEHLRRLQVRLRYGLPVSNPLQQEVHKRYPDVFAVATAIVADLGPMDGTPIPAEEIGFLTMYLAGSLERLRLRQKRRVTVVCPAGMATAWILVSRLLAEFPQLEVAQVVSKVAFEHSADDAATDLVISTVPLEGPPGPVPTLVVSPLLEARDVRRLGRLLGVPPRS